MITLVSRVFENDLPVESRLVGWSDLKGCSRAEPDGRDLTGQAVSNTF
jgi:hypothetical protein